MQFWSYSVKCTLMTGAILLVVTVLSSCSSAQTFAPTSTIRFRPSLIPSQVTFIPRFHESLADADTTGVTLQVENVVSGTTVKTGSGLGVMFRKRDLGYLFNQSNGDALYAIYLVVPDPFSIGKYEVRQGIQWRSLGEFIGIQNEAAAALITLSEPLAFSESIEDAGSICARDVTGQITIEKLQPLSGQFWFYCMNRQGEEFAISGAFSQ